MCRDEATIYAHKVEHYHLDSSQKCAYYAHKSYPLFSKLPLIKFLWHYKHLHYQLSGHSQNFTGTLASLLVLWLVVCMKVSHDQIRHKAHSIFLVI